MISLKSKNASVVIDPKAGGRLTSLCIYGLELLKSMSTEKDLNDPIMWGFYPMAPWAGRVRNGQFSYDGETFQLPKLMPPHAIHGTTFVTEWQQDSESQISVFLGNDWPFEGRAIQSFTIDDKKFTLRLEVHARDKPFPCSIGWHPWFCRKLKKGAAVELLFEAKAMYIKDEDGIPTGETCAPTEGPWDDCFTHLSQNPKLTWPGALQIELQSSADHWVVYNEREDAICVEPQTAPPDVFNHTPQIVRPEKPLTAEFELIWHKHKTDK